MKRILILAIFLISPLFAGAVNVAIGIGQPGYYGAVRVDGLAAPAVVYQTPMLIQWSPTVVNRPVYLRVPHAHYTNWCHYCSFYDACAAPTYFVTDTWYSTVLLPYYQVHPDFFVGFWGYDRFYFRGDRRFLPAERFGGRIARESGFRGGIARERGFRENGGGRWHEHAGVRFRDNGGGAFRERGAAPFNERRAGQFHERGDRGGQFHGGGERGGGGGRRGDRGERH